MAHLATVALTVQRAGWEDEAVAAAFLHDALEDPDRHGQRLARAALAEVVGEAVVALVEAVSEPQVNAEGERLPWRARKDAYLVRLARRAGPSVGDLPRRQAPQRLLDGVEPGGRRRHLHDGAGPGRAVRRAGPTSRGSSAPCWRPPSAMTTCVCPPCAPDWRRRSSGSSAPRGWASAAIRCSHADPRSRCHRTAQRKLPPFPKAARSIGGRPNSSRHSRARGNPYGAGADWSPTRDRMGPRSGSGMTV